MTDPAAAAPSSATWLLFLALFGVFGLSAHGYIENTDAEITMHAARAFWVRGDFGLDASADDSWPAEQAIAGAGLSGMQGVNGRHYVWFPIGHQLLMVPCVAVGDLLASWWPGPEAAYREALGPVFGEFYWTRFLVSFLPVLAAAGSVVLLLLIARLFGCSDRQAVLVAAVATFCTQFWPGASETMSDGPGMFFLLAMAWLVFRHERGPGGARTLLAAGICGGWAVLLRYPHAIPVLVLAVVVAVRAFRGGRPRDLLLLAAGALPQVMILALANVLRFGDLLETGYSAGANAAFRDYPSYLGIPCILAAPGKGVLWFSLPLWIAFSQVPLRGMTRSPWLPVLAMFALPVILHGHTAGWAAGQCWGIRYLTPAVVLLVTVALAIGKPWQRWPRRFTVICVLGLLASLGGVLTPYRGHQELAMAAGRVLYDNPEQVDNNVNFAPRFSPLHTHWSYCALSLGGRLEQGGAANTTEPLFGVTVPDDGARLSRPGEDLAMRHWWIPFAGHNFGAPVVLLMLLWVAATAGLLRAALRRLLAR